jgi:predicted nucleic acid-binding protein
MRVVIDCNVIVSAAITDGTCRLAIAEALANHEIVISKEIPAQYRAVAGRTKFHPHTRSRMHVLIDEIEARARVMKAFVLYHEAPA